MRQGWSVRKLHYWVSLAAAIPTLLVLISGLLLQVKKQWTWVQPGEHRGTGKQPTIELDDLLEIASSTGLMTRESWESIRRIDIRPGRALAKITLANDWEVQIDLGTGRVLQTEYKRTDWIESIHDGSFFGGDWVKLGIFLPNGLFLLFLWVTGLWLFIVPIRARKKRREQRAL